MTGGVSAALCNAGQSMSPTIDDDGHSEAMLFCDYLIDECGLA